MAKTTGTLASLTKYFSDEDSARAMLESLRWPDGVVCPHCGGDDPYKLTPKAKSKRPGRKGLYKCRACRKQFTVTVGTIFEASHVPISKWLMAIHLLCASKKSMSAHQLHRMLGITYRAVWFMAHRLRHAMKDDAMGLSGIVEVDETYVDGPRRSRAGRPGPNDPVKTPINDGSTDSVGLQRGSDATIAREACEAEAEGQQEAHSSNLGLFFRENEDDQVVPVVAVSHSLANGHAE